MKCEICGMEVSDDKMKHLHIQGKVKNICQGCVTAVKGLA